MTPIIVSAISTIISALISGGVAIIACNKQHDKTMALVQYRLEELEKKVDKHNNLVERMYVVETKLGIIDLRKTI